jgi:hypothetical protein
MGRIIWLLKKWEKRLKTLFPFFRAKVKRIQPPHLLKSNTHHVTGTISQISFTIVQIFQFFFAEELIEHPLLFNSQ